jgi:hypothetical protein
MDYDTFVFEDKLVFVCGATPIDMYLCLPKKIAYSRPNGYEDVELHLFDSTCCNVTKVVNHIKQQINPSAILRIYIHTS